VMKKKNYISGRWLEGAGEVLVSRDPADGEILWEGQSASPEQVARAVQSALDAKDSWALTPFKRRLELLLAYRGELEKRKEEFAELISRETGKPLWESRAEVGAMIAKIEISRKAFDERCPESERDALGGRSRLRYRAVGAAGVFGPFNLPGHLPNGHIAPALLAGNTIVFKPSEQTPLTGALLVECLVQAGLPPGVVGLVQGAREVGEALTKSNLDAIFFTGSYETGAAIHRALAGRPEVLLALEMGGNNPLVVFEVGDARAAAYAIIESAFITAGQRCTCARRLILPAGAEGDAVLDETLVALDKTRVGFWKDSPEPFLGPVISPRAADALLAAQEELVGKGGKALRRMERIGSAPALISPGLMDVASVAELPDREYFGPFLLVQRVADFDAAIQEANRTAFGLAAGLLSDNPGLYARFRDSVRAGIINWNRKLTGASSALPFGGVGRSGNFRPAAYFSADYCSYPVASLENDRLTLPDKLSPGLEA